MSAYLKHIVMVLGGVLLLVGIIGFFNDPVLGLFPVNGLHNVVHIATGGLLLAFAALRGDAGASLISKVFGVVYALVTILGFVAPDLMMQLLEADMADHILHVLLAAVFLFLGFGVKPKSA